VGDPGMLKDAQGMLKNRPRKKKKIRPRCWKKIEVLLELLGIMKIFRALK
jgi:hypothetical protein